MCVCIVGDRGTGNRADSTAVHIWSQVHSRIHVRTPFARSRAKPSHSNRRFTFSLLTGARHADLPVTRCDQSPCVDNCRPGRSVRARPPRTWLSRLRESALEHGAVLCVARPRSRKSTSDQQLQSRPATWLQLLFRRYALQAILFHDHMRAMFSH